MKKRLFVLLIIFSVKSTLSAQSIMLSQDFDGNPYISDYEIIFTSDVPSVIISGDIRSEVSTTIIPTSTNIIFIKASEEVNRLGGSKGTVIRSKPGVCLECPKNPSIKPKIDIRLNQSNNDIQIMSSEGLIIGYTLYDVTGKTITAEKTAPTNNYNIITTQLKKTIYILKIDLENQQYKTVKFIKN